MANELFFLPNPDNIPGAVSSGYQRQNTNMYALQTGTDTTEPYDNGQGVVSIPAGGIVEINGQMAVLGVSVALTKPDPGTAYWVAAADNGDGTANVDLVTRPGVWNPAKQGCYTADGARTLNWVSLGVPANVTETPFFSKTTKGTAPVSLRKGWYYAELASGAGGGNGGNGTTSTGIGGAGGVASVRRFANRVFFVKGQTTFTVKLGGDGFDGGNGGDGGKASPTGGGGGGGSGTGEASSIPELYLDTEESPGGNGGNGGDGSTTQNGGGRGGGIVGGDDKYPKTVNDSSLLGGPGMESFGGNGYSSGGSTYGLAGRSSDGFPGYSYPLNETGGGGGGGMGSHGMWRPDGDTASGYCNIRRMEN